MAHCCVDIMNYLFWLKCYDGIVPILIEENNRNMWFLPSIFCSVMVKGSLKIWLFLPLSFLLLQQGYQGMDFQGCLSFSRFFYRLTHAKLCLPAFGVGSCESFVIGWIRHLSRLLLLDQCKVGVVVIDFFWWRIDEVGVCPCLDWLGCK